MRESPTTWWVITWLFASIGTIFAVYIFPVIIMPLFYRFEPLKDEELTKRLVKLSEKISSELKVKKETIKKIKRAAYLCKADILTNMGREFPRLQGILGKEYALYSGEDPVVAQAIEEHKKPRFAGDSLPSSLEGAILAIVDKIDTLSGAFWIGFVPSGSEDPWGLRREAQGVVEIIIDKKIDISIEKLLSESMTLYGDDENARQKLGEFLQVEYLIFCEKRD